MDSWLQHGATMEVLAILLEQDHVVSRYWSGMASPSRLKLHAYQVHTMQRHQPW
jgi:hypothetical protein